MVTDLHIVVLKRHESVGRRVARIWNEDARVAVLPVEDLVVVRHLSIDLSADITLDKSLPNRMHLSNGQQSPQSKGHLNSNINNYLYLLTGTY